MDIDNAINKMLGQGGVQDVLQDPAIGRKKLLKPEIRVWIHPVRGDDFPMIFKTIGAAQNFIKSHPRAERELIIAYQGREMLLSDFLRQGGKLK